MHRLSGLDASFLYLETPRAHMHVGMIAIIEADQGGGGYSFERLQELVASRIHLVPPFRRRLLRVPFDLHHPVWIEDPDFDIIHHVRRVSVAAPGGRRELASLAGRILSTPLDRSRPLWEVWIIEGLKKGRVGFLTKVHHAAVDGVTGASLLAHLFDMEREPGSRPPPPPRTPEPIPSETDLLRDALAERAKQPWKMLKVVRDSVRAARDVVRVRRDKSIPNGATPLTAPRTRFNGSVAAQRSVAFARVPLRGVKTIKNAFGTTVNDAVLAVVAGALQRYLAAKDELPTTPLLATCPISVHSDTMSANKVSAMFTSLATDVSDPVERLRIIKQATRGAKEEHKAIGAAMLQNWAQFAAPTTFNVAARAYSAMNLADRHRPIHNLVISNVPGPPFPLYLGGAELVAVYPLGPVLEGAGLNVTALSYKDALDFGFIVSQNLCPDLWSLAEAVEPAFEELLRAAEQAKSPRAGANAS